MILTFGLIGCRLWLISGRIRGGSIHGSSVYLIFSSNVVILVDKTYVYLHH